jgi:protein SCO1/2
MNRPGLFEFSLVVLIAVTGCRHAADSPTLSGAAGSGSNRVFQVRGVVKELRPTEKSVVVRHEEIPGYMAAMTMPFEVRDVKELHGLQTNDSITFRMVVTEKEGWIEGVEKLGAPLAFATNSAPAPDPIRRVQSVESLAEGDLLPEYRFTNELGQVVNTRQFLGKAVALTFIFTSCPYPEFCPRMSNNFQEAADKLKALPGAPKNWHLLSLSFDTRVDTPDRLLTYALAYRYDPARWSFLTGAPDQIDAITEQFGLMFWRDAGVNISHNLRTAVIDARGRVQKILPANNWTSDELVAELVKASALK